MSSANSFNSPERSPLQSPREPSGQPDPTEPVERDSNAQVDLEEDLFGGEEDDESSGSAGEIVPDQDQVQENNQRNPLEYDEDNDSNPAPTRNLHIAEATLPNLPFPRPSDGKHWDLRIPNFLSLNPLPFSDEDFLNEDSESSDKEGGENDSSKLFTDQNVIRWRWRKDSNGKPIKQSNTRVICWEDGTQSLQVGSELFDMVYTVDGQQPASVKNPSQSSGTTQGLTYLFAQYSELKLLEAQASVTGQINLRPHTLNSLTHRTIVANRSFMKAHSQRQTVSRVITADPEKEKIDKELEEERKLKELKKLESKLARQNSRQAFLSEGGRATGGGGVRKRRFNAPLLSDDGELDQGLEDEEEEEEDYEGEMDEYENENTDDGARSQRPSTQNEPELTELELADQRLEQQERDRKKRSHRDSSNTIPKPGPVSDEPKVTKRKLIIASDDDD